MPFEKNEFRLGIEGKSSRGNKEKRRIRMALIDEKVVYGRDTTERPAVLAYELVQGSLVKWGSVMGKSKPDPPTAVLLHGILGSRKNWGCTASNNPSLALSMVEQAAKPLAQSVRVWSLDATPGKVRVGGDGEDHPAELISFIRKLPKEWLVTNLKRNGPPGLPSSSFSWMFDLDGISEMYQSYEETNLWKFVENLPQGVHVNFLKAERSLHRWALEDLQRIHAAEDLAAEEGAGVEMHVLEDAGHWVHADNPDGLFRILSSSFQGFKA
uniref:AB hydrolase-1 domain-containing protein n=1 Tax=Salix viminalis TaxID=40686 RepID=A0A6N2MKW9_SALVM